MRRHGRPQGSACRGTRTGPGACGRHSCPPRVASPWPTALCKTGGMSGTSHPLERAVLARHGVLGPVLDFVSLPLARPNGGVRAWQNTKSLRTNRPFANVHERILAVWNAIFQLDILLIRCARTGTSLGTGTSPGLARATAEAPMRRCLFRGAIRVGGPGQSVGARGRFARRAVLRGSSNCLVVATVGVAGSDAVIAAVVCTPGRSRGVGGGGFGRVCHWCVAGGRHGAPY